MEKFAFQRLLELIFFGFALQKMRLASLLEMLLVSLMAQLIL